MRKKHSYTFEVLARFIHDYLKEEGLALNFKGFNETRQNYIRMNEHYVSEVYENLNDCHLWCHYLQEVESFIHLKISQIQLEVDQTEAFYDKKNPDFELLKKADLLKEKLRHFKLFAKELKAQKNYFHKATENCSRLYKKNAHIL